MGDDSPCPRLRLLEIVAHRDRRRRCRPHFLLEAETESGLNREPAVADGLGMSDLIESSLTQGSLRPSRVTIWPIETGDYGIDFTYHGATGYADAERAERVMASHDIRTSFRQELDTAWTVRIGPFKREHMRAVLDRFAW